MQVRKEQCTQPLQSPEVSRSLEGGGNGVGRLESLADTFAAVDDVNLAINDQCGGDAPAFSP